MNAASQNDAVLQVQVHASVCVLRPKVPLHREAAGRVADEARTAVGKRVLVVVDLAAVTLIDGQGLNWLLDLDDAAAAKGGCVRLCNASELCSDVLRITGVGDRLSTWDTLDQALADLAT